eukprot:jgi/Botrbrau1/5950/Bobra.0366s0120.1
MASKEAACTAIEKLHGREVGGRKAMHVALALSRMERESQWLEKRHSRSSSSTLSSKPHTPTRHLSPNYGSGKSSDRYWWKAEGCTRSWQGDQEGRQSPGSDWEWSSDSPNLRKTHSLPYGSAPLASPHSPAYPGGLPPSTPFGWMPPGCVPAYPPHCSCYWPQFMGVPWFMAPAGPGPPAQGPGGVTGYPTHPPPTAPLPVPSGFHAVHAQPHCMAGVPGPQGTGAPPGSPGGCMLFISAASNPSRPHPPGQGGRHSNVPHSSFRNAAQPKNK